MMSNPFLWSRYGRLVMFYGLLWFPMSPYPPCGALTPLKSATVPHWSSMVLYGHLRSPKSLMISYGPYWYLTVPYRTC